MMNSVLKMMNFVLKMMNSVCRRDLDASSHRPQPQGLPVTTRRNPRRNPIPRLFLRDLSIAGMYIPATT